MEKQQETAYKEAIEEYRAVSQARMEKCSNLNSKSVLEVLPRTFFSYCIRPCLVLCTQTDETLNKKCFCHFIHIELWL